MKKLFLITFFLGFTTFTMGNNPEIKDISLSKETYSPGDSITISVEFTGDASAVSSVELFSREYYYDAPELKMQQMEDKNVWLLKGNVPYDTPPGTHHLEIKALNKNGKEIVDQCNECSYGKTGVIELKIE